MVYQFRLGVIASGFWIVLAQFTPFKIRDIRGRLWANVMLVTQSLHQDVAFLNWVPLF